MGSKSSGNTTVQKMTKAQRKAAVKAYYAGKMTGDIARKYGVSNQYIFKLVQKHIEIYG